MTGPVVQVEYLTAFEGTDLTDLCDAADSAIVAGGGFGWVRPPARHMFESYWKGLLLVPQRLLIVGRLDGVIAASAQLARPPANNEAQSFTATLMSNFVAPWARGYGLAKAVVLAAEKGARELGATLINLDIRETQTAAIQLYETLGYIRWGVHPYYAKVDGKLIRGFYYHKFIDTEAGGQVEPASALVGATF